MADHSEIARLLDIMARLRDPKSGCPWDVAQSFATIAPYTIEEAYEVAEAAESGDPDLLREELGDLLLQVVFHARMAEELGRFAFADVARTIADKMVRRHPHVFGAATIDSAAAQTVAWEDHKAEERRAKAASSGSEPSALDGVGVGLPALTRAAKLQRRAARVGFDWPDVAPIFDKIAEEIAELRHEIDVGAAQARIEDEVGDLLFAVVNLARRLDADPEQALRGTCRKFERRFRHVEAALAARGSSPAAASLDEMEAEWRRAKEQERAK
jgi:nucleoside triphosphate diphosphatase